jgi:hypothetical protein
MNQDQIGRIAVMGLILLGCWIAFINVIAKPIGTVDGKVIVPTTTKPVGVRRHNDIDHVIVIHRTHQDPKGPLEPDLTLYESAGEIYTTPDDPALKDYTVKDQRQVPQLYIGLDVGTYLGVMLNGSLASGDSRVDTGVRISDGRIFDLFSPDLLIGREAAGVGLSAFPPAELFGHYWQHLGAGIGEVWDYHSGHAHTLPYISLSIQF